MLGKHLEAAFFVYIFDQKIENTIRINNDMIQSSGIFTCSFGIPKYSPDSP